MRNRADGSVEAVASGPRATVETIAALARGSGRRCTVTDATCAVLENFEKRVTA